MNFFYSALLLIVTMGGVLFSFVIFGKIGIFIWIAFAGIIANIQVLKNVELFGFVVTLGNIVYASNFLCTDILSEVYNKKEAKRGVNIGFFSLIFATVIMQICLAFIPAESDIIQPALEKIFTIFPRVTFASLLAYYISQSHDVVAYEFWKNRFPGTKYLWIRNNFSTLISQIIDTAIFVLVAFWGVYKTGVVIEILITTYVAKFIIAICDTPFIYLAKKISPKVLEKE